MNDNLDSDLNKNVEIQKALKEFEIKNSEQVLQKIPLISNSSDVESSRMVQWVIKFSGGTIKGQKQAEYVLLIFVILSITVSLFLFFSGNKKQVKNNINPDTGEFIIRD